MLWSDQLLWLGFVAVAGAALAYCRATVRRPPRVQAQAAGE